MEKPVLVLDARAGNAEGPVWDDVKGLLYWVDIPGGKLHVFNPGTGEDRAIDAGQPAGCIAMKRTGGLVAALQNGIYDVDIDTGAISLLADPESRIPGNRFNDGKCDPAGRLWTGTMSADTKGTTGSLYVMDRDHNVRRVLSGVGISNGIAWSLDGRTMYFIDTPTLRIDAFDYDIRTGSISNRRGIIEVPAGMGYPDGMTIDAEGMLWVAMWEGWAVTRWDPDTGKLLEKIPVPAAKVSCCTFGGHDLNELYITTAREFIPEDQLAEQPNAGGIFKIRPGVAGLKAHKFDG